MPFPTTAISGADGTSSLSSFGGSVLPFTTLNAATATGAGTVADFGSAVNNVTMVLTGTADATLKVDLEGSVDNVNFFKLTVDTAAVANPPRAVLTSLKPCRYVRGNVIAIATGNVTAKLMACD